MVYWHTAPYLKKISYLMDYKRMLPAKRKSKFTTYSVYVLPATQWCQKLHCTPNSSMYDSEHAGNIRVNRNTFINDLRKSIVKQLGWGRLPQEFVFCRSVGRSITQIRWAQESMFKVKIYEPPHAYQADIFLLDATFADQSYPGDSAALYDISNFKEESESDDDRYVDTGNTQKKMNMATKSNVPENSRNSRSDFAARSGRKSLSRDLESSQVPGINVEDYSEISSRRGGGRGFPSMDEGDEELSELELITAKREQLEKKRRQLIAYMFDLLSKLKAKRNQNRSEWKRLYYLQKKKTPGLEAKDKELRQAIEAERKKILTYIRARFKDSRMLRDPKLTPLDKRSTNQLETALTKYRLEFDIDYLQRLVDEGKEKLTMEIKLRTQAEDETRFNQAEMQQKYMRMSILRIAELNKLTTSPPTEKRSVRLNFQ